MVIFLNKVGIMTKLERRKNMIKKIDQCGEQMKLLLSSAGIWSVRKPSLFLRFFWYLVVSTVAFNILGVFGFIFHHRHNLNMVLSGMGLGLSLTSVMIKVKYKINLFHLLKKLIF